MSGSELADIMDKYYTEIESLAIQRGLMKLRERLKHQSSSIQNIRAELKEQSSSMDNTMPRFPDLLDFSKIQTHL